MTEAVFKAPKAKKSSSISEDESQANSSKRRRTAEDFYLFCSFILEHEKYELKQEEIQGTSSNHHNPTENDGDNLDGEQLLESNNTEDTKPGDMETESSPSEEVLHISVDKTSRNNLMDVEEPVNIKHPDDDSYDLITCYCSKPFAGRPMIECSKCLTWIHLSCAKIKKTNIPEVFICVKCKNQKSNNIPTNSSVRPKKRLPV